MNEVDAYNLYVIYILDSGIDKDGNNVYTFLFAEEPDDVWVEQWNEKPCCNEINLQPETKDYQYAKELRSPIKLDLAQKNCCVSFMDIKDHVACLASENIDEYEEYLEPRIVIQYGDSMDSIERMLAERELGLKFV